MAAARSPQQFGEGHKGYVSLAAPRPDRRLVTPAEWREFQTRGFLKVESLVSADEVEGLRGIAAQDVRAFACDLRVFSDRLLVIPARMAELRA
jgi:hypothetical protein